MDSQIRIRYRAYLNEIITFRRDVSKLWEERIIGVFGNYFKKTLPQNGDLLRHYIAIEGGYKIPIEEYKCMHYQLRAFFAGKAQHYNNYIYLRGYEYYANDISMHLSSVNLTNTCAYYNISARLTQYTVNSKIIALLYDSCLSWIDYLGVQGFLEWIWNDIASLSWLLIICHADALIQSFNTIVDKVAKIIVDSIYGIFGQKAEMPPGLHIQLRDILCSPTLSTVLEYLNTKLQNEKYLYRSLREGDQLWLILACYEYKLLPWLEKHEYPAITLISNAFGAINSAFILKNCLAHKGYNIATAYNVLCSVHEGEMHRHLPFQSRFNLKPLDYQIEYAIIIDDSLFSGKTFQRICLELQYDYLHVYCLPLTFDVATIFNHPEEMTAKSTMLDSINYVEGLIREIGDNLAPARSYWAYKKKTPRSTNGICSEYNTKICGSDLLIRILWHRFKREILGELDSTNTS